MVRFLIVFLGFIPATILFGVVALVFYAGLPDGFTPEGLIRLVAFILSGFGWWGFFLFSSSPNAFSRWRLFLLLSGLSAISFVWLLYFYRWSTPSFFSKDFFELLLALAPTSTAIFLCIAHFRAGASARDPDSETHAE